MKILSATNPRYDANGNITLTLETDTFGVIEFGASPNDVEAHGRDLYAQAVAGDFGAIAVYVAPLQSPSQIQASLTAAVQNHLDTTSRQRNYDGILSLCSYAASTSPKFGPEGLAGVAWRDAVWASCYAILADVQAGTRAVPTADELLAELPAMVWPE